MSVACWLDPLGAAKQGAFSRQDQPVQTAFFDAAHNSLRVGVQIRTPWWQPLRFYIGVLQRAQEFVREQWIPIMNQIALTSEQTINGVGQVASVYLAGLYISLLAYASLRTTKPFLSSCRCRTGS